jgi:hypothetical protein
MIHLRGTTCPKPQSHGHDADQCAAGQCLHPESRFLIECRRLLAAGSTGTHLTSVGVYSLAQWSVYNNLAKSGERFPEFGIPFCNTSLHALILSYSSLCSRLLCPRLSTHCLGFESPVVSVSRYWHRCFCPHWRLLHSPSQSTGPQQLCPFATLRSSSTGTVRSNPLLKRMRSRASRCSATTPTIGPEGSSYSILCPILKR